MKIVLLGLLLVFGEMKAKSQDLSGEWKGSFETQTVEGSFSTDINLIFFTLTDTTYEVYSFTMFSPGSKDTIVVKLKGYMPKKNNLILEEVKAMNVINMDTCSYQTMDLYLSVGKKRITLSGKWKPISVCEGKGGTIVFTKPIKNKFRYAIATN